VFKHYAMKAYGGVEVKLNAFSKLNGGKWPHNGSRRGKEEKNRCLTGN